MASQKPIITTFCVGEDYKESLFMCLNSKAEYAKKNGYIYVQGGDDCWDRTRPIAWSKIPFLLQICALLPEGQLVFHSDADVLITNSNTLIEDAVVPLLPEDKDLLMSHDACGHINSGNILFRNTAWMRDFLARVYQQTQFLYHIWWENAAMIYLYETNPDDKKKIEISHEHKRFNAYLRGLPNEPLWTPGDLLVHFAGVYDPKIMADLAQQCLRGETPRISM